MSRARHRHTRSIAAAAAATLSVALVGQGVVTATAAPTTSGAATAEGSPAAGDPHDHLPDLDTRATRSATKTDTPLLDTPQSITVVSRQQIRDQNVQNLTEQLRYVPGVIPAQGENNRDEVVIRGDLGKREFIAFWLQDGKVVAGMNVNVWDVVDDVKALIRSGKQVDRARLADPDVPLDTLA